MRINLPHAAALLALCATAVPAAPSLQLDTPSPDWVIAEFNVGDAPFSALGDGLTDSTEAFQRAIDTAAGQGGGVVFVPAGTYRFDGTLVLKSGVTLRGEWVNPDTNGGAVVGSILAVYGGRGEVNGTPFITMEKVTCLRGLSFWYPEQFPSSIVPYPWTVDVTHTSSCGYTLRDITFVNVYKGLSNGAEDGLCYNVAYYDNLFGTPLKQGVWIEYVLDITRLQRIFFGPTYWENSGLSGAPGTMAEKASLRRHLMSEATAITIRRMDWCPLYRMRLEGYSIGIHLANKEDAPGAPNANGEIYDVQVTNGGTALLIDGGQAPGWLISRSAFESAIAGRPAVVCRPTLENIIQFNTCRLGGIAMENGMRGALSFENCEIDGVLKAESGVLSLVNTRFDPEHGGLTIEKGCPRALIAGGTLPVGDMTRIANADSVEHAVAPSRIDVSHDPFPFPPVPLPATSTMINVRSRGALGDGVADDTNAFVKALAAAGAAGGATVYVPAGRYRLTQPLVVPSGCELRGIFEGPPHAMIPGSCLLVEQGHGDEDGTPFLTLAPRAGVRGLVVWYPQQDINAIVPYPWTIRAAGPQCWVRDVAVSNPWQAVDFASAADTSGHFISGLMGSPLRRGLFVDRSSQGGTVESCQFVIHYWSRNDSGLPTAGLPTDRMGIPTMNRQLEAFRYGACKGEKVFNTFVYANQTGLALGDGFEGAVHFHGSDSAATGLRIDGHVKAELVNTNIAAWEGKDPVGYLVARDFSGEVRFMNSSTWGGCEPFRLGGTGSVVLSQFNAWGAFGGSVANPNTRITNLYSPKPQRVMWNVDAPPSPAMCFSPCEILGPNDLFPGTLLSRKCTTSACGEHSDWEGSGAAVDGSILSHWVCVKDEDHWIRLDLGAEHHITGIEILHEEAPLEGAYITRDFVVTGSTLVDSARQPIATVRDNKDGRTLHPADGTFRYIWLDITDPSGVPQDPAVRILEINVYGQR